MNYVGKIDFQPIRVLIYFHFTLLDHIILIGATCNGSFMA
jgi:hypothetical protein